MLRSVMASVTSEQMEVSAKPRAFRQSKLVAVAGMGLPRVSMLMGSSAAALTVTDAKQPAPTSRMRCAIMN